jgi:hypothetical protein
MASASAFNPGPKSTVPSSTSGDHASARRSLSASGLDERDPQLPGQLIDGILVRAIGEAASETRAAVVFGVGGLIHVVGVIHQRRTLCFSETLYAGRPPLLGGNRHVDPIAVSARPEGDVVVVIQGDEDHCGDLRELRRLLGVRQTTAIAPGLMGLGVVRVVGQHREG